MLANWNVTRLPYASYCVKSLIAEMDIVEEDVNERLLLVVAMKLVDGNGEFLQL